MAREDIVLPGKARITIDTRGLEARVKAEYRRRLLIALEELKNYIYQKLSEHSTKEEGPSSAGSYPHYDTHLLARTIFSRADEEEIRGIVGTPLLYGVILEYLRDRSFLRRALLEMEPRLKAIFTAPIPGGGGGGGISLG